MTYYIKGGSRFNAANPKAWMALFLGGFNESLYTTTWENLNDKGVETNKDPYWRLGSSSGGAQTAEFGLYNDFRIEIDQSTGIRGWNGSAWIDLLAGGGAGVSDVPYDESWDGDSDAATKNVLYDVIEELLNSSLGLTLFLHQDASGDVAGYRLLTTTLRLFTLVVERFSNCANWSFKVSICLTSSRYGAASFRRLQLLICRARLSLREQTDLQ